MKLFSCSSLKRSTVLFRIICLVSICYVSQARPIGGSNANEYEEQESSNVQLFDKTRNSHENHGKSLEHSRVGQLRTFQISTLNDQGQQNCDTQITLQLFDDLPVQRFKDPNCVSTAAARPRPDGVFVGEDGSMTLTMVQNPSTGRIAASINDYNTKMLYRIIGKESDGLIVTETPLANMMNEAEPRKIDEVILRQRTRRYLEQDHNYNYDSARMGDRALHHRNLQLQDDDSGDIIDIMVIWTKAAECGTSNLTVPCTVDSVSEANMMALVELAITETNEAFSVSGINTQLRLVHAYRHPTYTETSSNTFDNALDDVTSNNMGGVHAARNLYGADIVSLIINNDDACGIGWYTQGNLLKERMYSVTHYKCATGYYSFAHEIGHNLGCNHDRGTVDACDLGTNPDYNYGYRDPNGDFRSIMANNCRAAECDTDVDGCMRVPMFSNTVAQYENKVIGTENNNCARKINENRAVVAAFYTSNTNNTASSYSSIMSNTDSPYVSLLDSTPSSSPSLQPSSMPSAVPSRVPSISPSLLPSTVPSENPTTKSVPGGGDPSAAPSLTPSRVPSILPSLSPSTVPSENPTSKSVPGGGDPSVAPSTAPSGPSVLPSFSPSTVPSENPTTKSGAPSASPSIVPSGGDPSVAPSTAPSGPSNAPSLSPSTVPSENPTTKSGAPSASPSIVPSGGDPSVAPSTAPSGPSIAPSFSPSTVPSENPTTKSGAPSASPSIVPSGGDPSVAPSAAPSRVRTITAGSPSPIPSTVPSMIPDVPAAGASCVGNTEKVCGYTLDANGAVVASGYAVCVFRTDIGRYRTECHQASNLIGKDVGTFLNGVDQIYSCGCCSGDRRTSYCKNDAICVNQDNICGSSGNYAAVKYCYYNRKKRRNVQTCENPFNPPKNRFLQCGNCPYDGNNGTNGNKVSLGKGPKKKRQQSTRANPLSRLRAVHVRAKRTKRM